MEKIEIRIFRKNNYGKTKIEKKNYSQPATSICILTFAVHMIRK